MATVDEGVRAEEGSAPAHAGLRRRALGVAVVVAVCLVAGGGAMLAVAARPARPPAAPPRVLPEVPVSPMDLRVGLANNSPVVVADPAEPRFVALATRVDSPDFSCALHVSGDGGRSFVTVDPIPELPEGAEKCYAPEVAFDGHGTLHYLFVGLHGAGNEPIGAFLTSSGDRGQTFSPPRRVLGPLNFGVRMAVDPSVGRRGRIHLVWLHATSDPPLGGFGPPPNPILAAHSDDGGATFSEPVQVSDPARLRVVAPALAVGPDGAVHVAYYDLGDDAVDYQGLEGPVWEGTWSVVAATSLDGGRTFSGVVVDGAVVPAERVMLIFTMAPPSLAAGPGRRVCAAWTDARHGDPDALARCSADHGRSWGPPLRLNDDAVGNGRRQYLPRLAVAPGGRLDAVFLDRRRDPENVRNDVSYTFSTDGRSFAPNVRLTADASSARIGPDYPLVPSARDQVEIGARLGLLSRRSEVLAAWPDTRNSNPLTDAQDVFATTVVVPAGEGAPGWAGPVGAALVAAGLVVAALVVGAGVRAGARRPSAGRQGAALVAAVALAGGCRQPAGVAAPLPPPPPVVEVAMGAPEEYRFSLSRAAVPAGRVVFRARNVGRLDHHFALVPLPEALPPIDEQLRGPNRVAATPFAGIPVRAPGETGTFAVDLAAGQRYALVCFVQDADGTSHAVRGMSAEFRAGSGPAPP